jgi:hypothetical protein
MRAKHCSAAKYEVEVLAEERPMQEQKGERKGRRDEK